jgi:TPR repeat protein
LVFVAVLLTGAPVLAQVQARAGGQAFAHRHADGLLMEHRGNELGAYHAYLEAAEGGYPPAQRKLGEIYDSGSAVVDRDFQESIRWYQKAREGGEDIPPPKPRLPPILTTP